MVAKAVPGFLPSVYGLRFANSFPPGPTVRFGPFDTRILGFGDAASGLCGGMALTARDLFEARVPGAARHVPAGQRLAALRRPRPAPGPVARLVPRPPPLPRPPGVPRRPAHRHLGDARTRAGAGRCGPEGVAQDPGRDRRRAPVDRRARPVRGQLARGPHEEPPGAGLRVRGDARGDRPPRLRPQPPEPGRRPDPGRHPRRAGPGVARPHPDEPVDRRDPARVPPPAVPDRRRSRAPGAPPSRGSARALLQRRARRPAGIAPPRHRPARGRSRDVRMGRQRSSRAASSSMDSSSWTWSVPGRSSCTSSATAATSVRS